MKNDRRNAGGTYTTAKLGAKQAALIKLRIADGSVTVSQAAKTVGLTYMAVYKLAMGLTWKGIEPSGSVLKARGPRTRITPKFRARLYDAKRSESLSNAKLAKRLKLGETTVRRAVAAEHALLAARVHHLMLTSGSRREVIKRFELTELEADELVSFATSNRLSKKLQKELDDG